MPKKTVLKVNYQCQKCKTRVLHAVTKLNGIDQVSFDDEKGTIVVIGDVDPVCVAKRVRKTGMIADIESVGPPKKPDNPPKPSPSPPSPPSPTPRFVIVNHLPPCGCEVVAPGHSLPYDGGNCMIM